MFNLYQRQCHDDSVKSLDETRLRSRAQFHVDRIATTWPSFNYLAPYSVTNEKPPVSNGQRL
jgi:hypothetical protein